MDGRFPVIARIQVRWRDIDPLGHVNNAVYFTYFETARARYYEEVLDARGIEDIDFLVASIRCDYLSPVVYGETVEVGIRVVWVGKTSWSFEYEARTGDGRVVARADSVQVRFDHQTGRPRPLDEDWIARVTRAQGGPPAPKPNDGPESGEPAPHAVTGERR
ncbi:acyl-CoA thioesterase [Deferrisoma camini]|uniref:acyl-CoA thioesterase n=1 Tax=Deferrisoma camini TaxID=1035120 RepID=UPI00046D5079|nr:thioesterase family protein [Deferrisoma camini]